MKKNLDLNVLGLETGQEPLTEFLWKFLEINSKIVENFGEFHKVKVNAKESEMFWSMS